MGLLDHRIALFLVFKETSILFSIGAAPIYIPTNGVGGFPFLHILKLVISCLFDNIHSNGYEVMPHCGFDFPDG